MIIFQLSMMKYFSLDIRYVGNVTLYIFFRYKSIKNLFGLGLFIFHIWFISAFQFYLFITTLTTLLILKIDLFFPVHCPICFRYFSYEHFYVIYCKFWELDTDHDFLIDKENLIRYGNHALTYRIVDRIFSQVYHFSIFSYLGYVTCSVILIYFLGCFTHLSKSCYLKLPKVPRKFTSKVEGKMGYEDFVYFILSEEDKSSEPSLEYWYVYI